VVVNPRAESRHLHDPRSGCAEGSGGAIGTDAVTGRSSTMSPSLVGIRWTIPPLGPDVRVDTTSAPSNRSMAFLVIRAPLLVVELLSVAVKSVPFRSRRAQVASSQYYAVDCVPDLGSRTYCFSAVFDFICIYNTMSIYHD
jgi:hypothetical protein